MGLVPTIFFVILGILMAATWFEWAVVEGTWSVIEQNGTTSVIGSTALLAALVAVWGVLSQRAIARRQVTYEQIVGFLTDQDVIKARRNFIKLAKQPEGLVGYAASDQEVSPDTQDIILTMNFYELFSIGIQKGIIDYDLFKQWNKTA